MGAVHRDLTIEQGVTWAVAWTVHLDGADLDPADGWQARSQVREAAPSILPPGILHEFSASVTGSVVQLSVTAEESSRWVWRRGVYDVEIFTPSRVIRIVRGSVQVSSEVTRGTA